MNCFSTRFPEGSKIVRVGIGLLLLLLLIAAAGEQPADARRSTLVKIATLAPKNSSWHKILEAMADEWERISDGAVRVRLYAGGVAGDDPDVVRKMRLGTIQAGVLTAVGISEIDPSVYAAEIPMMYDSYEEVYYVLDKMRDHIEGRIRAKGFEVLNWADGGWVHFFTKSPVAAPRDLRPLKLFMWAGSHDEIKIVKAAGFNPVPLPATEIATALQTGLVEAINVSPQVAVISQFYLHAPNMTDLKWQLLLGATVINSATWQQIPGELRPRLAEAARRAGERLRDASRVSYENDIEAMKKRGLKVISVNSEQRSAWSEAVNKVNGEIRGAVVPAESFDLAEKYRSEYRLKKKQLL